ncbi:MAG TPA: hypothetical protein VJT74_09170 [Pyrinomonadaceae bacterium]|nr:hypothetical protein [Pyrinomonadaceae bacterium]
MRRNALSLTICCTLLLTGKSILAQSTETPRLEIGAHFTALGFSRDFEPGVGGRLTYNLTETFAVEAEGNFFPRDRFHGLRAGGRAVQGLFGVKVGKRYKRFGIFGKARPGFISFSEGISELVPDDSVFDPQAPLNFRTRRLTHFAADLGGVLEIYPSRRVLLRIDAGDTIIRYGNTTVNTFQLIPGDPFVPEPFTIPGDTKHNLQLSAGVSFRF